MLQTGGVASALLPRAPAVMLRPTPHYCPASSSSPWPGLVVLLLLLRLLCTPFSTCLCVPVCWASAAEGAGCCLGEQTSGHSTVQQPGRNSWGQHAAVLLLAEQVPPSLGRTAALLSHLPPAVCRSVPLEHQHGAMQPSRLHGLFTVRQRCGTCRPAGQKEWAAVRWRGWASSGSKQAAGMKLEASSTLPFVAGEACTQ